MPKTYCAYPLETNLPPAKIAGSLRPPRSNVVNLTGNNHEVVEGE